MTKTAYEFKNIYEMDINQYFIDKIHNVFDLIIIDKSLEILLDVGISKSYAEQLHKAQNNLREAEVHNQDYLYSVNLLKLFGASESVVCRLRDISNDLLDIINRLYSGRIYFEDSFVESVLTPCDKFLEEFSSDVEYIKELILFYLMKNKKVKSENFYDDVNRYLSSLKVRIPENVSVISLTIDLIQDGYIITEWGYYEFPGNILFDVDRDVIRRSYKDFLKNDFNHKDELLYLLDGKSEIFVATAFEKSVDEVKEDIKNIFYVFNQSIEFYKYRNAFEEYRLDAKIFCGLFDESIETYNIMNAFCDSGVKRLTYEEYNNHKDDFFIYSDEKFASDNLLDGRFGRNLVEFITLNNDYVFSKSVFMSMYNREYGTTKIQNEYDLDNRLQKAGLTIEGSLGQIRYYDYNRNVSLLIELNKIIKKLDDGYYSFFRIYDNNKSLMQSLDVKNYYELFSFFCYFENIFSRIKLIKRPYFHIGDDSEFVFFKKYMDEHSGMAIDEISDQMNEKFGLSVQYIKRFILNHFGEKHISDSKINQEINDKLSEDIYPDDKFKIIIGKDYDDGLNAQFGYIHRGDVYVKNTYYSISKALKHVIMISDFDDVKYNILLKSRSIKTSLRFLQRELEVFQIEPGKYCTIEYLKDISDGEIDKKDISDFISNFVINSRKHRFVSVKMLLDSLDDKIVEYYFNECFYDDIINYSDRLRVVKRNTKNNLRIYSNNYEDELDDFISIELSKQGNVSDIMDFIDEIKKKYGVTFSRDSVIKNCSYYAEYLERIYNNKEDYYLDKQKGD